MEALDIAPPTVTSLAKSEKDAAEQAHESNRVVYFRALNTTDIDQLRELHEDWFPIRYNQEFYNGASQGRWNETGGPLFSRLAIEIQQSSVYDSLPDPVAEKSHEEILGAVTASTIPISSIDDGQLFDAGMTASNGEPHTQIMYILTLGSKRSVRRKGIASALLRECIYQAERTPSCGAVYLHVKADNVSALRFYEKNGFQNLRFLQDYYLINEKRHGAYLYIYYVNGAGPPIGWTAYLTQPFKALYSFASNGLRKLLESLAEDDADENSRIQEQNSKVADCV